MQGPGPTRRPTTRSGSPASYWINTPTRMGSRGSSRIGATSTSTTASPIGPTRPSSPPPAKWLKLLNDQWAKDQESIDAIHEQFGYLVTPDTSQQRIMLWIGPPRSGRGTMKEILTALIGAGNVASTSAASLAGDFGL